MDLAAAQHHQHFSGANLQSTFQMNKFLSGKLPMIAFKAGIALKAFAENARRKA